MVCPIPVALGGHSPQKQGWNGMRGVVRTVVIGGLVAGAAVLGVGSASALGLQPLPGGVQVDLSHDETMWVRDNNIGIAASRLPHPSAESFGYTLQAVSEKASEYPAGRVSFTMFGPFDQLSGTMVAFEQ
jgi:hypothetical protein